MTSIPSFSNKIFVPFMLASTVFIGACATQGPPPVADLAVARTSVSQAEAAGAAQYAPVEFLNARNKLASAEAAMRDKRYDDARAYTDEAAVDADVAERKSRAMKADNAAMELQRSNAVLGSEIDRSSTRP
jgi:allantoicase